MTLKQRLESACADRDELQLAQDYADEASPSLFEGLDWHVLLRTGHLGGQRSEVRRLQPILSALIDVAEAAYELSSKGVSVTRLNMQTEGLARLEKLCGEEK